MAEITIKFRRDGKTGKREIVIHLESEPDALPHEHEQDHKKLVESLTGLKLDEDDTVVVERIAPAGQKTGQVEGQPPPKQREAETNKAG
jgi:hypothetical protein